MRAVIQRVKEAKVSVHNPEQGHEVIAGEIGQGYLVYLGIGSDDELRDEEYIVDKICHLRIFPDADGRFNHDILDIKGAVLLVSQFTLYGDARKGRRPSFSQAALPEQANNVYQNIQKKLSAKGLHAATGVFGAHMIVSSINDGPVTILIDSKKAF